jgi:hypothetical protein
VTLKEENLSHQQQGQCSRRDVLKQTRWRWTCLIRQWRRGFMRWKLWFESGQGFGKSHQVSADIWVKL